MRNQDGMDKRVKHISIGLFFSFLLLLGLSRYRDFGISWDEPLQRLTGAVTVNYLAETFHTPAFMTWWQQDVPALAKYGDRDYGVAFEAPAFALEQIFRLKDSRDIYMFRHLCLILAVYMIVASVFVRLMWPYLWHHPLDHLLEAFNNMAHFRWGGAIRYMGALIPAGAVPWHYTFTWISITTPLLYLALFVVGVYATFSQIVVRGMKLWQDDGEFQDIVFLGLFFAPILAVILFHSVLYDGWRQLYFVYPAFLLLATKGWVVLWSIKSTRNGYKTSLVILTTISAFCTAIWMWKAHPLENVYFNIFAGRNVKARYDVDYWGLGNRGALEYILKKDHSPLVNVCADSTTPIENSVLMLRPEDRRRARVGNDIRVPYYVLNNYRVVKDLDNAKYARDYKLFYEKRVNDEVVLSVFKWKGQPPGTKNSCAGDNPQQNTEVAK